MKDVKLDFLFLAILAAASIVGMGFSLGLGSAIGMIACFILLMATMGYGFSRKKKQREAHKQHAQ